MNHYNTQNVKNLKSSDITVFCEFLVVYKIWEMADNGRLVSKEALDNVGIVK